MSRVENRKRAADTRPAEVLFVYGLTIMLVGGLAFNAAGMNRNAASAILVSNGFATVLYVCAALVRQHGALQKGDSGYVPYMIGIHLGLVMPIVYGLACAVRMAKAWPVPSKQYLLPYLGVNVVASFAVFVILMRFKPQKNKEKDRKPEPPPRPGTLQRRSHVAQTTVQEKSD